jgi:CTP synthase (UTP-ammonia lyase)
MIRPVRIGIVGDYNPEFVAHTTTDESLRHVADARGVAIESEWVPTSSISPADPAASLDRWDGLWISAGSPYRDRDGALAAIRFARERLRPMVAT